MRLIRNPVTQFLVIGLLTVLAIFVGVNNLAGRAASDEALAEARRTNAVLAKSIARPAIPRGLVSQDVGALDEYDRATKARLLIGDVESVTIWDRDGTILYSTEGAEWFGKRFPLDADQLRILRHGGTGSQKADPSRPINEAMGANEDTPQYEIYTRVQTPEREPVLIEGYYSLNQIGDRQGEIFSSFHWLLGPLILLIIVATLILGGMTRQLNRASTERERLLRSAMDASDAERRRIARDLHDSVVQDLAGTAFSVSAVARNPGTPPDSRKTLVTAGSSLRSSLKSLRSLVAEIHPPDLHAEGLAAALEDLIAPAGAAGMQASVSVEGAETASHEKAALVWRVAQEAVRNALRHSGASTIAVTVRGDGTRLTLEVVDDGTGFDPARVTDPHSYGLRGLRSLVADNGGVLDVRSSPGEGTTVRMEVDAQ